MTDTKGRGGMRPGSGRKTIPEKEKRQTAAIVLPPETIARLDVLATSM